MLQDQNEIKEDRLNNARSKTSRHFRNKRREYMQEEINKLEPNSSGSLSPRHGASSGCVWIEEQPPIRWVAANKLNKQSQTANEGWSSSLGVGRGANNPSL